MAEAIGTQRRRIRNLGEPKSGKLGEVLGFISKFAFESTVVQSLRISNGRKQGGSKDEPFPVPFNDNRKPQDPKLATEEIQSRIEKMQAEIDRMKGHPKAPSANCSEISRETLQAKIEKMQRDMCDITPQCTASSSTKCVEQPLVSKKNPGREDVKGFELLGNNKKRVFIRSRL